MQLQKFVLFLVLIGAQCFAQSWQQLPDFPAAGRDDGSVFVIGNKVYCGLGNVQGVGPSADFQKFDLLTDTWVGSIVSLPALGRQYCCSFSYGAYGFIITGVDANWNATNEVWRYDTVSDSWMQKTSMPDSVQGAACFFINNKAYICGGRNQANQCAKKVWEYDVVNDSWQQRNNMPGGGRWRASAAVVNGKGYLVFGADDNGKFSNKLYEYDAGGDSWLLIDSFPGIGRTYAMAVAINNFMVVGLGIDTVNAVHNDCYLYDVISHQWIAQNVLPSFGRKGCMAFSQNDSFYLTAGIDGSNTRLTETWKAGGMNGVEENAGMNEVKLFPNPTQGWITAEFAHYKEKIEVHVYDLTGTPVFGAWCEGRCSFDANELKNGSYFIEFRSKSGTQRMKIIVCK